MKVLFFFLFIYTFLGCLDPPVAHEIMVKPASDTIMAESPKKVSLLTFDFEKITISFLEKGIYKFSSDDDSSKCTNWFLTKDIVKKIMISSRKKSNETKHSKFDYLSCSYNRSIIFKGKSYNFMINFGS